MSEFTISFAGLGSHWWVFIYDELESKLLNKIDLKLKSEVENFEKQYSRFKKESLISELNRNKKLTNFPTELFHILKICEDTKLVSGGSFNIFVGSVLENLGYDSQYSFNVKNNSLSVIKKTGFVSFSENYLEITDDSKIDLGGIGKGYLIDKLGKILKNEFGLKFFAINGGGDIFSTGKPNQAEEIFLENPKNVKEAIGKIALQNSAIASSGQNKRQWLDTKTKEKYAHLIPLVNNNDKTIEAVYTYGKSSLSTDLSATCLFVSSPEYFSKIKKIFQISFLLVFKDGTYLQDPDFPAKLW